jgi:chromosome segregation ATPase
MNQQENCCDGRQAVTSDVLQALRTAATDVSTPEVTVSLTEYNLILDGISTHMGLIQRQKNAVEQRLVATRQEAVNYLEYSQSHVARLKDQVNGLNVEIAARECSIGILNHATNHLLDARDAKIADLEKQLRAAKRNRK